MTSSDKWFVEVTDCDGQVVAIESEMLTGRDIGEREREVIDRAIRHLAGVLGSPHESDQDDLVRTLERKLAEVTLAGWPMTAVRIAPRACGSGSNSMVPAMFATPS